MKCVKCGYDSPVQFTQCPSCGTVQPAGQYTYSNASVYRTSQSNKKSFERTGGEKASIIIAVVVSVISVIAAFIIAIVYSVNTVSNAVSQENYGMDAFDDFDSNEYDKDIENFFKNYYDKEETYTMQSPAGRNTPVKFKETLYSFSAGNVETEYEVSMTETFRGEAALKLLEGAALPEYDKDRYEIYLVRFRVRITDQEKDAIVTLPLNTPAAYPADADNILASNYQVIDQLEYVNRHALVSKGDDVETWISFIVDKTEETPTVLWNSFENKAFRDDKAAVSDANAVEAGAAIEQNLDDASSNG